MKTQPKIELIVNDLDGKEIDKIEFTDIDSAIEMRDKDNANGKYTSKIYINGECLSDTEPDRKLLLTKYGLMKENDSIGALVHQGKTISQWEKLLKDQFSFTQNQILNLIKCGVDLSRMVQELDETDAGFDDPVFKDEEFFFNESTQSKDIVTVEDFIEAMKNDATATDKIAFIAGDKAYALNDIRSKGGVAVVEFAEKNANQLNEFEDEDEDDEDVTFTVSDLIDELKDATTSPNFDLVIANVDGNPYYITGVSFKKNAVLLACSPIRTTNESMTSEQQHEAAAQSNANEYQIDDALKKSQKNLDNAGTCSSQIGWCAVDQLDPKAKDKMIGWRCGPSNFPFVDLLYPERTYKTGTMVMRNKYVKAGSMSGQKYIAIPSYFAAIKDNDQEAINLLNILGIPLDLTFGMNPDDDYSNAYTLKQ